MKEALAQAIEVAFAGAMASNDPKAARSIARAICTTLGITREMVRTKATNQWTIDIFTALLDLAEGDT